MHIFLCVSYYHIGVFYASSSPHFRLQLPQTHLKSIIMTYTITNGKLDNATQIGSPNFNTRPQGEISAIIIHNISLPPNEFGKTDKHGNHYVTALFTNTLNSDDHPYFETIKNLQVSAHLFIQRNGQIIQYVNFDDRAWHAGQSSFLGRANCNDYSIGIELEGTDDTVFDDRQYTALAHVVYAIYQAYPATYRHLAGHSDIAPVRKTDPGKCFDWQRLRKMVDKLSHQNS